MGKAIRNFKDALAGVEEAKYRRIDESGAKPTELPRQPAAAASEAPADSSKPQA